MKRPTGFTIVELVIVIAVIAILAAVTIVAYNGVQARADTTARVKETEEWEDLIDLYMSEKGTLPMPSGVVFNEGNTESIYCLGSGFPDTDFRSSGPNYNTGSCATMYPCFPESSNCASAYLRGHVEPNLNTELAKVGALPTTGPRTCPAGECSMGPYVTFHNGNSGLNKSAILRNVFAATTCPATYIKNYQYPSTGTPKIVGCDKEIFLNQ